MMDACPERPDFDQIVAVQVIRPADPVQTAIDYGPFEYEHTVYRLKLFDGSVVDIGFDYDLAETWLIPDCPEPPRPPRKKFV